MPAWATQNRTDPLVLEFATLMPPFSMLAIQAQVVVSTTVPSGCPYGWRLKTDSSGDCAVVVPSKQELSGGISINVQPTAHWGGVCRGMTCELTVVGQGEC